MRRKRSVAVVATAVLFLGCGALTDLEPLAFIDVPLDGGGASDSPSPLQDSSLTEDGGRRDAQLEVDAKVPFCATVDARVCTDFDDDAGAGTPWRDALPTQTLVGMGELAAPHVKSATDQPDRGPFLVTTFVPDSGAQIGYHVNTREHSNPTPGWVGGVAPARRYELKIYVEQSDPVANSIIVSTDPAYSLALALVCNQPAGACQIFASRGSAGYTLADILIPQQTWTKIVWDIPAATRADAGGVEAPTQFDVTVEVTGKGPIRKTASFSGVVAAQAEEVVYIGLARPNAVEGPWKVWYDDVALSY